MNVYRKWGQQYGAATIAMHEQCYVCRGKIVGLDRRQQIR